MNVPYEYAVLRAVPRVERGEVVNVAVLLYCQDRDFLGCAVDLDAERVLALDPQADLDAVRQALELGLPEIAERARWLGARLRERLNALPGVTTHDLGAQRCAIVTAAVAGVPTAQVADALAAERINVSTTVPSDTQFDTEDRAVHPLVRLSPHYYNTEAELDRAVEVIARVATG